MSEPTQASPARPHTAAAAQAQSHSLLAHFIALLLRLLASTWRLRLENVAGLENSADAPPVIWCLWHNRILIVPILYNRFFRRRKGAALISRSKDGGILASCIALFGGDTVRGSTSRGGSAALLEMKDRISKGWDIYITPDGPRGPRYHFSSGAIWLAQSATTPILPLNVEFSSVWRFGKWDGFIVPRPFATVTITLQKLEEVPATPTEHEFEAERERLRALMMQGTLRH